MKLFNSYFRKLRIYLKKYPFILNLYIFKIRRIMRLFIVIRTAFQELFVPFPPGSKTLGSSKLLITRAESTYFGDGVATIRFSEHLENKRFITSYDKAWANVNSDWLQKTKVDIRLRAHICSWAAQHCKTLEGDFLEFGTYFGILALMMCDYISFEKLNKKFYLFDTWGPLPGHHPSYPDDIFDQVKNRFNQYPNVKMVRGVVPESISQISLDKIAYIGIDMNGYLAERAVLDQLYEKLVPGGIIYLDDYGWGGSPNLLRETVDDFFATKPEELLCFPSGNAIIIKL